MKNINGSEEPLFEYKSDVIKEIDVEDLHYMQDNRQNTTRNWRCEQRTKTGNTPIYPSRNYAREMHNKARLGQHPKARYTTSISCAQIWAQNAQWGRAWSPYYSRSAWLPASLPFSDCQVKAILQVGAWRLWRADVRIQFGRNRQRKNDGNLHDMQGEWTK